jgi:hypothetical protein
LHEELKKTRRPGRPFLLILLALGFLLFSLTGWMRLYLAIQDWQLLVSLGLFPGPLYLAIYGLITGLFGVAAAVGLWLRWPWAPAVVWVGALAAAAWYWLDRLFFTQSASSWTNWPFSAGLTAACLLFVFLTLPVPRQRKISNSDQEQPGDLVEESVVPHEQNQ